MRALWLLVLAALVMLPGAASAQAGVPHMSTTVEAERVEVGQPFTVQLEVTADASGPEPSDARLPLPAGMTASGPSISSQTQISFVNGRMSRSSGISARWQVVASQPGTFNLGPPRVAWNGRRVAANAVRVTVVPAGAAPRPQRRGGGSGNPFDPFGMFPNFPNLFDTPQQRDPSPQLNEDPEIAMAAAPDPNLFLRAIVDPPAAVIGEQVTLNVYVYVREGWDLRETEAHEPALSDFYRRELMAPDAPGETRLTAVNGTVFHVQPIFRVALFPLKAGDLDIGAYRATFSTRRAPSLKRESQPLHVRVTEPPAKGRPVGYQIGDVGSYTMAASVEPRTVEAGGTVSVVATITGVGNVPNALRVPLQT